MALDREQTLPAFHWQRYPRTEAHLDRLVGSVLEGNPFAARLAQRMAAETGTRFIDWVDHLVLSRRDGLEAELEGLGYQTPVICSDTQDFCVHSEVDPMSFEVEVKYRGADHFALAARLEALGAEAELPVEQADTYLAHPARDFRQTNEALRLRLHGTSNRITYKGPRLEGPTKTREEVEIGFEDGPDALQKMTRLFEALGFAPVATVRKVREAYHLTFQGRPIEVGLDEAEGLGTFAEVEAFASSLEDLPEARAAVLALAEQLGLRPDQVEPRSYLRMVLEANADSAPPRDPS